MKKCPKCDFSYPDEKNYCKNCGSKLTSTLSSEDIAQRSVFEDKIMLNPLNTEILKEYAQFLYNKLLHTDAIDILNKILVIDKNDSFANELLYKSYEKVGNLEDAAKIAEKLLDSNPLDLVLLKDLSEIAFKSEKEKEALVYLNRFIEIKPNDKYALIKKSEILLKLNNEKETLEALEKVLEVAPDNVMAQFEVGINSCMENDYRKACELLGAILIKLKNDDDKNKALFFYSYALFKLSPYDKRLLSRIQGINIALLVNNLNNQERILLEELLIFQGNLNIEQKNFDNAINSYNEAYLLNKSNISKQILADKLFEFAKDKFNAKEITCSKENIEKALYLYPDNKEYKVLLDNIRKVIIKKRKKIIIWSIVSFFVMIIILCSILIPPFLTEKRAWEKAKSENTSHAYQAFIDEYSSNCWYADEAYKKIKQKDSIKEAKNAAEDSSFAIIENSKITTMLNEY